MATVGGEHLQGSVTILQIPTNPTLPRSFTTSQSRETLLAHGDGQKQAGICRGLQVQDRQPELRSMVSEAPPKARRQQPWHLACDHLAETMYSSDCPWEAGGPSTMSAVADISRTGACSSLLIKAGTVTLHWWA